MNLPSTAVRCGGTHSGPEGRTRIAIEGNLLMTQWPFAVPSHLLQRPSPPR